MMRVQSVPRLRFCLVKNLLNRKNLLKSNRLRALLKEATLQIRMIYNLLQSKKSKLQHWEEKVHNFWIEVKKGRVVHYMNSHWNQPYIPKIRSTIFIRLRVWYIEVIAKMMIKNQIKRVKKLQEILHIWDIKLKLIGKVWMISKLKKHPKNF